MRHIRLDDDVERGGMGGSHGRTREDVDGVDIVDEVDVGIE